ncbi:MAG: 16S rRNA (guanine(966)-N(2))-methyltransferase RsmD [Ruminococcaceae bacterium]|nr:16S rRNA (guanine(966)-N(2))-methyltransferase RsmD [Oscillospiraceae bacterium]
MRIITGSAKGAVLKTLDGEKTRPTAEKVKEAVFSALQFDLEGRTFLDLFAGSGQMGLEALSRGAARAVFIDEARDAMEIVKENAKKTGFFDRSHFLVSDYRNYLRKAAGREVFDIVFIDPPYAEQIAVDAMLRVINADMVKEGTLFVLEGEDPIEEIQRADLTLVRAKKYGRAWIHIFRYGEATFDE